jgi:hypothetical protein
VTGTTNAADKTVLNKDVLPTLSGKEFKLILPIMVQFILSIQEIGELRIL